MVAGLRLRAMTGRQFVPFVDDLATLPIHAFREWPYLYEGDQAYEAGYLSKLAESHAALLATVFDDDQVVGASTALPLAA